MCIAAALGSSGFTFFFLCAAHNPGRLTCPAWQPSALPLSCTPSLSFISSQFFANYPASLELGDLPTSASGVPGLQLCTTCLFMVGLNIVLSLSCLLCKIPCFLRTPFSESVWTVEPCITPCLPQSCSFPLRVRKRGSFFTWPVSHSLPLFSALTFYLLLS